MTALDELPSTSQEDQDVDLMVSLSDGKLNEDQARGILRRFNGDINRAMNAIFEEGESAPHQAMEVDRRHNNTPGPSTSRQEMETRTQDIIDLTGSENNKEYSQDTEPLATGGFDQGDDDLARALKASLETTSEAAFQPSDRAPDPQWAMVPSNVEAGPAMTQDDQHLSRAIEASLSSSMEDMTNVEYDVVPDAEALRNDIRPVALRPVDPKLCYTGLVIQALYVIEEVRQAVASLKLSDNHASSDAGLSALQQLFARMDSCPDAVLSVEEVIKSITTPPWISLRERPGDVSVGFFETVARAIRVAMTAHGSNAKLFNIPYGRVEGNHQVNLEGEAYIVPVDSSSENLTVPNDLMSRLTNLQLFEKSMILELSQVVTFHVSPAIHPRPTDTKTRPSFTFPKTIYLDRFLDENIDTVRAKWDQKKSLTHSAALLEERKNAITHFDNKDTLLNLKTSLRYYESVADAGGSSERQDTIKKMADKLRRVMEALNQELTVLDSEIAELNTRCGQLFDVPELQQYKYELKAVLIHNGLHGQKNIYSYVQHEGKWWKTVDASVCEVSEEVVFEDQTGVHLGAGPYILIYNCVASPPDEEVDVDYITPYDSM